MNGQQNIKISEH